MARSFNGSSDFASNATGIITAAPLSMACWFRKPNEASYSNVVMGCFNSGSIFTRDQFRLNLNNQVAGSPVVAQATTASPTGTSSSSCNSPGNSETYTGLYVHCGAVFSSATSRLAYFNGSPGTPQTTSRIPSGIDRCAVGVNYASTPANYANGDIAEAAMWNVALSDSDMASLARGVSPLLVRPESLVAYWPLGGNYSPEIDPVGKFDLTLTGTAKADHPRILMPRGRQIFLPAASAPPTGNRRRRLLLGAA